MPIEMTPEIITAAALGVLVIILLIWNIRLEKKLRVLLASKNAQTIDDTLTDLQHSVKELSTFQQNAETHLRDLEHRMQRTIRGVDTVRFNPFQGDGSGGNHSFATAFVTERGDGVVISSLFTRERTNVFTKPLAQLKPHQELSEEEEDVVQRAHAQTRRKSS